MCRSCLSHANKFVNQKVVEAIDTLDLSVSQLQDDSAIFKTLLGFAPSKSVLQTID